MANEIEAAADTAANEQQGAAEQPQPRTYTESERDAYVKARIDKQNAKHAGELAERDARIDELSKASEAMKAELERFKRDAQLREWAAEAAKQTGVDASVLRGDSLDEMVAHGNAIKGAFKGYPPVPGNSGTTPPITKDQIFAVKDAAERRRLIAENAELFR